MDGPLNTLSGPSLSPDRSGLAPAEFLGLVGLSEMSYRSGGSRQSPQPRTSGFAGVPGIPVLPGAPDFAAARRKRGPPPKKTAPAVKPGLAAPLSLSRRA